MPYGLRYVPVGREVSEAEKDEAIALARRDYVDGRITLAQFEAEVGYALAGDLERAGYLSPFPPPVEWA